MIGFILCVCLQSTPPSSPRPSSADELHEVLLVVLKVDLFEHVHLLPLFLRHLLAAVHVEEHLDSFGEAVNSFLCSGQTRLSSR